MIHPSNHQAVNEILTTVNDSVVGQAHLTRAMAIALLTGGHILLEGLPGTAKTRAVKSLANALNIDYSRIQFTPDLLPSDITGTNMYDKDSEQFHFQKGPIFSSIVLADEVNRAPAKVQAALLEAMAEQTVTFAGESYQLPEPFMVLATQNPIEQEGTYPLPEAQMDRFAMKVEVSYPSRETEIDIIKLVRQEALLGNSVKAKQSTSNTLNLIAEGKQEVKEVYCADSIDCYIADLVIATRETERYPNSQLKEWIEVGVSPRASLSLDSCSRANAWLDGRDYVTPDDVRSVAHSVLCHRIRPTFTAHASGVTTHKIIDELLNVVPLT